MSNELNAAEGNNESAANASASTSSSTHISETKAGGTSRSGAHPLSWINLVLMIVLVTVAGYLGFLGWQQQQTISMELAILKDRLATATDALSRNEERSNDLLEKAELLSDSSSSLAEQVAFNTERLGKLPGAERQDWLLAEAEYLLRLANQRLSLERDWEGSLSLLVAADNVLVETRNPKLDKVRAIIAREIVALRAVPAVDRVGAIHRLQALQETITTLSWLPNRVMAEAIDVTAPIETDDLAEPWYQKSLRIAQENVNRLVRIRKRDEEIPAPLTPDQQYYLQQNMHLMLEQAQVALLREQAQLYTHSIKRVQNWVNEFVMIDDERSLAAKATLQELLEWNADPEQPDISGSLLALQTLVEQERRGGSVVPSQRETSAATTSTPTGVVTVMTEGRGL